MVFCVASSSLRAFRQRGRLLSLCGADGCAERSLNLGLVVLPEALRALPQVWCPASARRNLSRPVLGLLLQSAWDEEEDAAPRRVLTITKSLPITDGTPVELGRGAMGVTYKAFDVDLRVFKVAKDAILGAKK